MKAPRTRREFLAEVASGALLATVGQPRVTQDRVEQERITAASARLKFGE
jgi:hypothetical protein